MAVDPGVVRDVNIGRQMFFEQYSGRNKAIATIEVINRNFGYTWEAVPTECRRDHLHSNIVITCPDKWSVREWVAKELKSIHQDNARHGHHNHPSLRNIYWMDIGNERDFGQIMLGSENIEQPESDGNTTFNKLTNIVEFKKDQDVKQIVIEEGPSCSQRESIFRQDLFINQQMALLASDMLWHLLSKYFIPYNMLFWNNQTKNVNTTFYEKPIPVSHDSSKTKSGSLKRNGRISKVDR
jgi:PRTRC genetic system ThiF family protein